MSFSGRCPYGLAVPAGAPDSGRLLGHGAQARTLPVLEMEGPRPGFRVGITREERTGLKGPRPMRSRMSRAPTAKQVGWSEA